MTDTKLGELYANVNVKKSTSSDAYLSMTPDGAGNCLPFPKSSDYYLAPAGMGDLRLFRSFMQDVASGLAFLHSHKVCLIQMIKVLCYR